ncbi:hypothetical protein [Streptomyces sp. NRRL S-1022]
MKSNIGHTHWSAGHVSLLTAVRTRT